MFNKLIKKLNGHAIEPATLTEALEQLGRDRETVQAEIADLNGKRRQALLDDASDAELDKIERAIDRANVRLEKINVAEQPLRDQLAQAKGQAHTREVQRQAGLIVEAYSRLRDVLLEVDAAHQDFVRVRMAAVAAVGEHAVTTTIPIEGMALLANGIVDSWTRYNDALVERFRSPAKPRPVPAAAPAPRRAAERPAGSTQHAVSHFGGLSTVELEKSTLPKRLPDDTSALRDGNVRVKVIREGYPDSDGGYSVAGRLIQIPRTTAEAAARNGAVAIVEGAQ